jgi:hypothetical protein
MCPDLWSILDFLGWLRTNEQSIAIWLEGIALVAIFILELVEYKRQGRERIEQHKESAAQMAIMQSQADALVNSERAWVVAELVPQAAKFGDHWCRFVGSGHASMTPEEILAGHHLRHKLKFTNMGRTPAQIFSFTIRYSCLGEGVTDLPENAGGNQASTHPFEHLLAGNGEAVEIGDPIVDVGKYIEHEFDAIKSLKKTGVIHGSVKYRHMFSSVDDCYADFCYSYTVSQERLSSVGRHTKQRQVKP